MAHPAPTHYELRFRSLAPESGTYAFPCAPDGSVDMDHLTERQRLDYLYARAVVGRELAPPSILPCAVE